MKNSSNSRLVPIAILFVVVLSAAGCRQKVQTKSTITVTYTLQEDIAAAKQIDGELDKWEWAEPISALQGNIVGDTTDPSYVEASVFPANGDAAGKSVVIRFRSPGFSSSETLTVSKISFVGPKLVVQYDKVSPELKVTDFRQLTTLVHVAWAFSP